MDEVEIFDGNDFIMESFEDWKIRNSVGDAEYARDILDGLELQDANDASYFGVDSQRFLKAVENEKAFCERAIWED